MTIDERNKILTDNLGMIHHFLHKRWKINKEHEYYEDIVQECCVAFLERFDEYYRHNKETEKNGPVGYIYWSVACGVKRYYRNIKPKFIEYSGDVEADSEVEDTTYFDVLFGVDNEDQYGNEIIDYIYSLNKKTQIPGKSKHCKLERPEIVLDYYIYGKTQKELAKEYNVSQSRINQLLQQEFTKLKILVKKKFGNDVYTHYSF